MILVTGGAGFIGSHTAELLASQGVGVRILDDLSTGKRENLDHLDVELVVGDIRDREVVRRCVEDCDAVIHLAARPGVPESCSDPLEFDLVNVHGAAVVFECARRAGVERVVYASSAAVYGSSPKLPAREEEPVAPESPYGANKAADELYGSVYTRALGVECVGLRYFNVFGPRQDPGGPYAAVIPRFVEAALAGSPLTVFGDGGQSRDFVFVGDVARANWLAATTPGAGGLVLNVGSGHGTTLNQLAAHVLGVVDTAAGVVHLEPREGDVRHSVARVSLARDVLGFAASADFDAAMQQTIAWYAQVLRQERG